jgi:chromatin modification-related protein VID21
VVTCQFLITLALCRGLYFQDSLIPFSLEAIERNPAVKASQSHVTPTATGLGIIDEPADTPALTYSEPKAHANSPDDTEANHANPSTQSLYHVTPVNPPGRETQRHGPRTAHLPPKEVQEERFREKQLRQEARRKDAVELEKPTGEPTPSLVPTVGASSMPSPAAAGPSPLTSTGAHVAPANQVVEKPESLRPSAEERLAKEQHDSLLQSQKEIAYNEALGPDDDSPDVQLRLEQEQAARATRDATSHTKTTDLVNSTTSTRDQESPSDSVSDVAHKDAISRPPLINPSKPSLVTTTTDPSDGGASSNKSISELPHSCKSTLLASKRSYTTGDLPKIKVEQQVKKRQPRPIKEQPLSPVSQRFSALLKNEGYMALKGASAELSKDYLEPLYRIQVHDPPNGKPTHELLQKASKVVTTAEQFAGYHERQDQRILRRIYQLQNANRWSLRQMEPCPEPAAPKTHMDHLLTEMKWMRTDFRQERKIKKATAKYLAEQCAEWVKADFETRQTMQVHITSSNAAHQDAVVPHSPAETNFETSDRHSQGAKTPPGLDIDIESSADDFDMPRTPLYATVAPLSFFSDINMDKDTLHLQEHEAFHNALADLPLLAPFEDEETPANSISQRPTPSVSKFCTGKIITEVGGPPRKRSRFDYADEYETTDDFHGHVSKRPRASQDDSGLQPEQTDLALFEPENKLLRARLHQNTAFRPPSEFQMPSTQFYEFRTASQWTEEDQQALRRLAKDYSFNWSLIADNLSLPSRFTGATDRRTPWECFERWVELESLPNEMRKTLYFKTWNSRLEGASRNNEVKYQAQLAQLAQTPGQPQAHPRKKTTPVKVDKRRQNRYLHMVDAMRKLARKREQQAHKQAEGSSILRLR